MLSFKDGVKVAKARGEAVQAASDAVDSGMVSVVGLDKEKVGELCAQLPVRGLVRRFTYARETMLSVGLPRLVM